MGSGAKLTAFSLPSPTSLRQLEVDKKGDAEACHDKSFHHLGGIEFHGDLDVTSNSSHPRVEACPGSTGFGQQQGVPDEVGGRDGFRFGENVGRGAMSLSSSE